MYLITGRKADGEFTKPSPRGDLAEARTIAENWLNNGVVEVQVWQLALNVTTEAKVVFRAPNGKVE